MAVTQLDNVGTVVDDDYHVEVAHNYYSVPYQLVHAQVETRATASTVEVFAHGRRVASTSGSPGVAGFRRRSRTWRTRTGPTRNGRRRG